MEDDARQLLNELKLPDHIGYLFELYGLRTISDLTSVDNSIITDIVDCVRNGSFAALVDLEVLPNRIKYLGFNYKCLSTFNFLPFDVRKLLGVSAAAKLRLLNLESSEKKASISKNPVKKENSVDFVDEDYYDDNDNAIYSSAEETEQQNQSKTEVTASIKLEDGTEIGEVEVPVLSTSLKIKKNPLKSTKTSSKTLTSKTPTSKPSKSTSKTAPVSITKAQKRSDKTDKDLGLKFHIVNGKKFYECTICGKNKYSDRHSLKEHLLSHGTERNFLCQVCSAAFKTKAVLYTHMHKHRTWFYYCDLCPKKYKVKFELREHIHATHLTLRTHVCQFCGKGFTRAGSLTAHLMIHGGERNEICEVCGFKTFNKGKLNRHMKTHTGERNYACSICGKLFLYDYNVTAHIRHVHYKEKRQVTAEEKLTCTICCHKFPKIWKLKEHLQNFHGITS